MNTINRRKFIATAAALSLTSTGLCAAAGEPPAAAIANPFYAMDTSFQRPGLTLAQQLDLVKELGYAGVAWTHHSIDQDKADLQAIEQRGLKMFAIYCGATATLDGKLTLPPDLPQLMAALKGHGTIVWIHIGGRGPKFDTLTDKDPTVQSLRSIAETAADNDLRVAIYPHFGEWTEHFGDATRLAKLVAHQRFGVTFNLCHALAAGDEAKIPAMLDSTKNHLFTATICGADRGIAGPRWDRLIQTLDKGSFDVGALLRKLQQIGFDGAIGFQGFGIKGDARSILTPTMSAWQQMQR